MNNALGEEGVPILMMGEERFAVAVADGFSRVTCGKQIGACTVMANLNAAGIQMAYGAIAQAWEDSSPLLVIAEGVGQGASRHTHYDMAEAFKSVTKWVGKVDRADLVPDYVRRASPLSRHNQLRRLDKFQPALTLVSLFSDNADLRRELSVGPGTARSAIVERDRRCSFCQLTPYRWTGFRLREGA